VARQQHCFSPVDFGSSQYSQESVLRVTVPRAGFEFQVISAVTTWNWRLHPCSELHCLLERDLPEHVPVRLSRGINAEAAHGKNFFINCPPGKLIDVRVLLSTRFGICVWYSYSTVGLTTLEAPNRPTAAPETAAKRAESPVALKRTAERVGGFSSFRERNAPQSMDAFKRGSGTPMGGRRDSSPGTSQTAHRSRRGAFSRAVAAPGSSGGADDPQALAPKVARPPRRLVRLSLSEAKDLLEALRRVCTHQSFRRALDTLRRRELGAFKKRQAMAKLLGQWWKEQLRESGFTIDEHGFPQMLAAIRAHRDSAGVDIVSREVERLLAFPPGSLFSGKGQGEVVEVTLRHAVDGDEVKVSVPEHTTLLEVRNALAVKLRRPEVLEECAIVQRTAAGGLETLGNYQPLNCRRSLLVSGASISCAELAAATAASEGEAAQRVAKELAVIAAARRAAQTAKQAEEEAALGAVREEAAAEAVQEATPPAAGSPARVWLVVGGAGKGGIIVREDIDLKSAELPRLEKGAKVRELERSGNRLRYQKLQGTGPEVGWVNVMLNEKTKLLKLLQGG